MNELSIAIEMAVSQPFNSPARAAICAGSCLKLFGLRY
jgi:hypothetical protein